MRFKDHLSKESTELLTTIFTSSRLHLELPDNIVFKEIAYSSVGGLFTNDKGVLERCIAFEQSGLNMKYINSCALTEIESRLFSSKEPVKNHPSFLE